MFADEHTGFLISGAIDERLTGELNLAVSTDSSGERVVPLRLVVSGHTDMAGSVEQ